MAVLTKLGIEDRTNIRFVSQDDLSSIYSSKKGDISVIYSEVDGEIEYSDIYVTGQSQTNSEEVEPHHIAGGWGFSSEELRDWFEDNKEAIETIVTNIQQGSDIPVIRRFNISFIAGGQEYANKSEKDTVFLRIPITGITNEENENNIKISVSGMYFEYYFPYSSVDGKLFLVNASSGFKLSDIISTDFKAYTPNTTSTYGEKQFSRQELEPMLKKNIWKSKMEKYQDDELDEVDEYSIYSINALDVKKLKDDLNPNVEKQFIFVTKYSRTGDANYEYQIIYGPKVVFELPILTYSCSAELFDVVQPENLINTKVNYSIYNDMKVNIDAPLYNQTGTDFAKPETNYIYIPEKKNADIIHYGSNMNANFTKIENQSLGINTDIHDEVVYYKIYKSPAQYLGNNSWILKNIK